MRKILTLIILLACFFLVSCGEKKGPTLEVEKINTKIAPDTEEEAFRSDLSSETEVTYE